MEFLLSIITIVFGLVVGSFMNVVIIHLPNYSPLGFRRSQCPHCKNKLSWFENLPVLSFIALHAKCRHCSQKISWQYPLVEIWHGLMAFLILNEWWLLDLEQQVASLATFLIVAIFTAHFIIDWRHHLLLDKLNIALLFPIIALIWISQSWMEALVGASFGLFIPLAITWLFYKLRGVIGLGGGDIKLFGLLGMLFGIKGVVLNIFTSCMLGSVVTIMLIVLKIVKRDQHIAFGPYILITALIQLIYPNYFQLWAAYLIPSY